MRRRCGGLGVFCARFCPRKCAGKMVNDHLIRTEIAPADFAEHPGRRGKVLWHQAVIAVMATIIANSRGKSTRALPALLKGRQPVTTAGGSGAVPAGKGFVPSALGRFGYHVCRHDDRHARCSLQPGPAPAGNPATEAPAPRNLVRSRTLGCVSPKGRPLWNADRRARPAQGARFAER